VVCGVGNVALQSTEEPRGWSAGIAGQTPITTLPPSNSSTTSFATTRLSFRRCGREDIMNNGEVFGRSPFLLVGCGSLSSMRWQQHHQPMPAEHPPPGLRSLLSCRERCRPPALGMHCTGGQWMDDSTMLSQFSLLQIQWYKSGLHLLQLERHPDKLLGWHSLCVVAVGATAN